MAGWQPAPQIARGSPMTSRCVLCGLLALAQLAPAAPAAEGVKAVAVGDKAPDVAALRDVRGNRRPLHGFKDNKALVLVFLGTECPVSNLYLPGLLALEKSYRPRGVQFLAVYPNEPEDLDRIAAHAFDR